MTDQKILEIDDLNWGKNVEKSDKPVMVMFYSPTCPHCHSIEPYFKEYSIEFKDRVIFAKLNIVKNPNITKKLGVMGTPTFKFFCKGRPVIEMVGAVYPYLLKKNVEDALLNSSDCVKKTSWIDSSITGYG
jgi:thiol-disulfide isomerase/thioredoxin